MSEARRAIFGFVKELGGVFADLVAGAGNWGADQARKYLTFLRRAGLVFLIIAGILIVALFAGVIAKQDWLITTSGLLIGIATATILGLATPLGALAVRFSEEVKSVGNYLRIVGGILLWELLLTLYFSVVPISNNPRAIILVILITFIVALFWAVYGISPSPHRIYASVVSVFLITTLSLFFPKTFAATIGLRVRLDEKLATCLTSLSTCFSQPPPVGEKLGGVELPTVQGRRIGSPTARKPLAKEQEPGGAQWQEAPEISKQREPEGAMRVEVPQPRSESGGAAYQPLPQERLPQSGGASFQPLPSSPSARP